MKRWHEQIEPEPEAPAVVMAEVRYPLPQLLAEIRVEKTNRALGNDHLNQQAVESLFKTRAKRHVRRRE